MKFKEMKRNEKINKITPGEEKNIKDENGKYLKATEIKKRILEINKNRLQITIEDGKDPIGQLTIKQQIENIEFLNKKEISFYKQFEKTSNPEIK